MRPLQCGLFLAIFVSAGACFAQVRISEKQLRERQEAPPKPVAVTYRVIAEIIPETLLIRASIDVEYRNSTSEPITELAIVSPINTHVTKESSCQHSHIDSVLVNGAPIAGISQFHG
jgi:hypothetical protein